MNKVGKTYSKMKKTVLILSAVAMIGSVGYFTLGGSAQHSVTLKTLSVKKGTITNEVTATGTIEPITQVEVGTQVSGTIERIYVDYNSGVVANQLIAELDKTTLLANVSEAKVNLKAARNDQEYQQKQYDRAVELARGQAVSQSDYEDALYNLKAAKIVTAQRETDLLKAQTNLGYASIYSPISGVVISRSVDVGQTVAASYSTPTLFTIAQDLKRMQVEADVDEADIGQVKVGQRVHFTVDAYPDDTFSGSVTQVRLEPTEESNVVTYTVIIKADNEEGKLMPGLTANINIYTLEIDGILILEAKTLNFDPDEQLLNQYYEQHNIEPAAHTATSDHQTVWVRQGERIYPQAIRTGESDGVYYEVLEGLSEGQEVIYSLTQAEGNQEVADQASSPFMPKLSGKKK